MAIPTNKTELDAWLNNQPEQVHIVVAARSAMRAFPSVIAVRDGRTNEKKLALVTGRALISSAVAGTMPTAELDEEFVSAARSAVRFAESAVNSAADADAAALSAAYSAGDAAGFSAAFSAVESAAESAANSATDIVLSVVYSAAYSVAMSATYFDCNGRTEFQPPACYEALLWPEGVLPEGLKGLSAQMLETIPRTGSVWSFWRNWYEGFLNGEPLDWELQKRVALIPDDVWEAGVEAVAEAIEEIERRLKVQVGTRLVRNEAREKFEEEAPEFVSVSTKDFVIERAKNALRSALEDGGTNGFNEGSYEYRHLAPILATPNVDPRMAATTCWDVCMSLKRNIGNLYPEDTSLIVLQNTLYICVEDLCEESDRIKSDIGKLAALETQKYPTQEDKDDLFKVSDLFADEMADGARERYQSDVETILTTDKPPRSVRVRVTDWTTTMYEWMDKAKKMDGHQKWVGSVVKRLMKWFFKDGDT